MSFIPGETYISASGKVLDETDKEFMKKAVDDGWLTEGNGRTNWRAVFVTFINVVSALLL